MSLRHPFLRRSSAPVEPTPAAKPTYGELEAQLVVVRRERDRATHDLQVMQDRVRDLQRDLRSDALMLDSYKAENRALREAVEPV